jgi:hypothetical protein
MKLSNLYLIQELLEELKMIRDRKRLFQNKKKDDLPAAIAEELELINEREEEILNKLKEL